MCKVNKTENKGIDYRVVCMCTYVCIYKVQILSLFTVK